MTKPDLQSRDSGEFLRSLNPLAMLCNLWGYRDLIRQFTAREVLGRYRGSFLGFAWAFASPLLMLGVYTFVFGTILHPVFDTTKEAPKAFDPRFAMELFCGMIVFNIFSETIARAPQLIVSNVNYVKKVVFPLEVLPVSVLGSSLVQGAMSTLVLLLGLVVFGKYLSFSAFIVLALPVLLPLVMLCCGLAWITASLGVFVRDLNQIVTFVIQFLMFLTPIFYLPTYFPQEYRWVFNLNPLAVIVTDMRRAMIWGETLWWPGWWAVTGISFVFMMIGYAWFMHSKKFFADVI